MNTNRYLKPNKRLQINGLVHTIGGTKPYVYIRTSEWPNEENVRIETSEENVKLFIPYLYKNVSAVFDTGLAVKIQEEVG